jgi:hypothetical protein
VVRLDRVDDVLGLAVALRLLRRDDGVRALDLVRHRLAEVVQERGALRRLHLAPSSDAMIPARWTHSSECLRMFCP